MLIGVQQEAHQLQIILVIMVDGGVRAQARWKEDAVPRRTVRIMTNTRTVHTAKSDVGNKFFPLATTRNNHEMKQRCYPREHQIKLPYNAVATTVLLVASNSRLAVRYSRRSA